jgi:NAD(P)-dependent dehydrogenase (short-subunit alcohol dehydrogenase family)
MVAIIILQIIVLIDIYHHNVAGKAYKIVDLTGKVFVVTGSNTGLGYETAVALVHMGGTVVMACRSIEKANAARMDILKRTACPPSKVLPRAISVLRIAHYHVIRNVNAGYCAATGFMQL